MRVIRAERTFCEKATILHHEAYRSEGNPLRDSRHYHDLARMADAPVKDVYAARTSFNRSGCRSNTLNSFTSASGGLVLPFS
ncbi:MAG: nucleotidyl transferase AbiEii/AbiGii toxin family protein [Betaproteobacteria bacterium]|nr:nucleotidyl transferase AbiEii/AbiGii toxin family protein [Betaproteobacteria bacterium]